MSENARLLAFTEKVNLPLFGDITHFILESAKASQEQIRELSHRCVLFDTEREPDSIQEKYSFLYLGELLERYEERFGMPLPDLRLLGKGRTITVIGNLLLFGWFIREANPLVKTMRTKDSALLRALCSLQKSFIRPGCHPHDVLLAEGYTTLEIAYANVLAVRSQLFDGEISGLFFAEYGIQGIGRFFSGNRTRVFSPLVEKRYGYGKADLILTLCRDFFSEEEHREILGWLQEYYFVEQPASYMMLVKAVLFDEFAPTLLTAEEQRTLFDLLAECGVLNAGERNALKQRYLTTAELQAESDAQARKEREQEQKREADRVQRIREGYAAKLGSFKDVYRFLDGHRYHQRDLLTACSLTADGLDAQLKDAAYTLGCLGIGWFLKICGVLVAHEAINLAEIENYLQMIKEDDDCDNENDGGRGCVRGTCLHDCKDGKGQTRPALAS